jgi:hypothetical protein
MSLDGEVCNQWKSGELGLATGVHDFHSAAEPSAMMSSSYTLDSQTWGCSGLEEDVRGRGNVQVDR